MAFLKPEPEIFRSLPASRQAAECRLSRGGNKQRRRSSACVMSTVRAQRRRVVNHSAVVSLVNLTTRGQHAPQAWFRLLPINGRYVAESMAMHSVTKAGLVLGRGLGGPYSVSRDSRLASCRLYNRYMPGGNGRSTEATWLLTGLGISMLFKAARERRNACGMGCVQLGRSSYPRHSPCPARPSATSVRLGVVPATNENAPRGAHPRTSVCSEFPGRCSAHR